MRIRNNISTISLESSLETIKDVPIAEWLRTRPSKEVRSFIRWYFEYHNIQEDWCRTLPEEQHKEVRAVINVLYIVEQE